MATSEDFIKQALINGTLTYHHLALLVSDFQSKHGLDPDGKPGAHTLAALDPLVESPVITLHKEQFLRNPLPVLSDGRKAQMTSEFRPKDRPDHDGVDFFYRWKKGDQPAFSGDHGGAGRNPDGTPKWVVPHDIMAIAAAAGVVQMAGNSPTGYRIWIDHGNGWRSGYFHLQNLEVAVGQAVGVGKNLGRIGDNPTDNDGRHLHFEISPIEKYSPTNPLGFFLKGEV